MYFSALLGVVTTARWWLQNLVWKWPGKSAIPSDHPVPATAQKSSARLGCDLWAGVGYDAPTLMSDPSPSQIASFMDKVILLSLNEGFVRASTHLLVVLQIARSLISHEYFKMLGEVGWLHEHLERLYLFERVRKRNRERDIFYPLGHWTVTNRFGSDKLGAKTSS